MTIYDVTRELSHLTMVFPGDPAPDLKRIDRSDYFITSLCMTSHSGTHIDAPAHIIRGGTTIDKIPLDILVGKAQVADLTAVKGAIGPKDLENQLPCSKRLLIKTSFSSQQKFSPEFPYLSLEAAEYIISEGITCVGIDTPSVESFNGDGTVHRRLLGAGVIIIELLDLSMVPEGEYDMAALPLRLKGLDGSPARVLLFEPEMRSNMQ